MAGIGGQTDNKAIQETRDTLKELTKEIKKSIKASSKLNKSILWLTGIMVVIVIIEFFTKIWPWLVKLFCKIIDFF